MLECGKWQDYTLMKEDKVHVLINELIQISLDKINYKKINKNTLQEDIVFLDKYDKLKTLLEIDSISEIDITEYPEIGELKKIISQLVD